MSTLATIPRELQCKILNYLPVEARMQQCAPLTPIPHLANALFNLSIVSKFYRDVVEVHCTHQLKLLNARLLSRLRLVPASTSTSVPASTSTSVPASTSTLDLASTSIINIYIHLARTHCNICSSITSISGSILGTRTPICFECDWENWTAIIRAGCRQQIYVLDSVPMLVSCDIGNESKALTALWKGALGELTEDYSDIFTEYSFSELDEALRSLKKLLVSAVTDARLFPRPSLGVVGGSGCCCKFAALFISYGHDVQYIWAIPADGTSDGLE